MSETAHRLHLFDCVTFYKIAKIGKLLGIIKHALKLILIYGEI